MTFGFQLEPKDNFYENLGADGPKTVNEAILMTYLLIIMALFILFFPMFMKIIFVISIISVQVI